MKQSTIRLERSMSFDKVLGHTVYLGDDAIHYVDGSRRKALAFIRRLQKAKVDAC